MTLILTMGNDQQCLYVADRRFTYDGVIRDETDDRENKSGLLVCDHVRLIYGFTGLARSGTFDTNEWLLKELPKCASPDFSFDQLLIRLKEQLDDSFTRHRDLVCLSPEQRKLTVVFVGYDYREQPPLITRTVVSNFENWVDGDVLEEADDQFFLSHSLEKRPNRGSPFFINAFGARSAVRDSEIDKLAAMIFNRVPAQGILGKASEVVLEAANRPSAKGLIGNSLSGVIIPRDPKLPIEGKFYSSDASIVSYGVPYVYATSKGTTVFGGSALFSAPPDAEIDFKKLIRSNFTEGTEDLEPVVYPKARRKAPCPCGSGKRYKNCHGRI